MRYVEHSPHALLGSIVIDCDHPDAAMRAFEKPSDHPAPNWVAQSPSGRPPRVRPASGATAPLSCVNGGFCTGR
jgi:hypothetical protein